MKTNKLEIEYSTRIDDKTGKTIWIFTPVIKGHVTAMGELRFARWEVWSDAGQAIIATAKKNAIDNARTVLLEMIGE